MFDRALFKEKARGSLQKASYDPKKLILIHTGASVLLALLLNLVNYFLEEQISGTGGLGGMGLRSALSTAQTVLQLALTVATPFWAAGLLCAMLRMAHGEEVSPRTLLGGFRRFGKVLGHGLLKDGIFLGASIILVYAVSFLFLATPFSRPLMAALTQLPDEVLLSGDPNVMLSDPALLQALSDSVVPFVLMYCLLVLPILGLLFYAYRMSLYLLLRCPHFGAFLSLMFSKRMMRGNKWQLFKLDLSFWWYYLLQAAAQIPIYLTLVPAMLGISLPWSMLTQLVVSLLLSGLCQVLVDVYAKAKVELTYVHAFDAIFDGFSQPANGMVVPVMPQEPRKNVE